MTALRLVCGQRPTTPVPGAQLAGMALALSDHARQLGFRVVRMESSIQARSPSRYLMLADPAGREWILRVSQHHRPAVTGHAIPHFDLVSLDGRSGLDEAKSFLARARLGEVTWMPPARSPHRKRGRR